MNKVILIGGAPTAGKSYITRTLSKKFQLPWISTDGIRGMMREIVKKNDFPSLFNLDRDDKAIEEYLSSTSIQKILEHHIYENIEVWKGAKAILDTDHVWNQFIIEGVAILPSLVSKIESQPYKTKPIFLVNNNRNRIRNIVYNKGLWNGSTSFSDKVKEIEIEWVILFNKYIETEAIKFGYPTYDIDNQEQRVDDLSVELGKWLDE